MRTKIKSEVMYKIFFTRYLYSFRSAKSTREICAREKRELIRLLSAYGESLKLYDRRFLPHLSV